ncbi:DUF1007 family protein [Donghicola mangrovi]|uniref:DUF1007 family protein n=1 Tax=Donghicola mangrovi TaxID=2729614 RepID=A0A850QFI4_9RHOB|nr:DUF1007 family protein [Donghicola mangrovi]NVO25698.1 hypothetical protein [Donghicola mangrovi]
MRALWTIALAALAGPLAAHPHTSVDQQVHIAIGPEQAKVAIRIVPSAADGDVTRAVLDLDGNGVIDPAEADVFRNTVIGALSVTWSETAIVPINADIRIAPLEDLAAGLGTIELTADFPINTPLRSLEIEMLYDGLGAEWFIQPFFFDGVFADNPPRITRFDDTNRIELDAV